MMNYEEFKKIVAEQFKRYLPEEYQNMELRIEPIHKVNRMVDGLYLVKNEGTRSVMPTIYVNEMYERYLNTGNLPEVLRGMATIIGRALTDASHIAEMFTEDKFKSAKDNIVFQVINTEQNREMLNEMPQREFLDLSIVYRWVIDVDAEGISSSLIKNKLAEKLGMNEEQLFRSAMENTRRLFPPVVRPVEDILCDMSRSIGMSEEMIEEMPEVMMHVISNDRGINGAVSILYEDNLHELAEKLKTDLYILPSSVHECVALSAGMDNPYELAEMVNKINMSELDLKDRLSNQVYYYDKDTRKLSVATDTPHKSLE